MSEDLDTLVRRRILIFCSESRGLGHLQRMSQIAVALAMEHAVLLVTSDLLAGDFVKPPLEFVRIPPLDTSDASRVRHWDRGVFLGGLVEFALPLRTEILAATFRSFRPHAMITDFFANGRGGELLPHLRNSDSKCLNYLVLRGVLGDVAYSKERIFSPQALRSLSHCYKRIFVACDSRVLQATEYQLPPSIEWKCQTVGYVYTPSDETKRAATRHAFGIKPEETWIVCSAGSGLSSERLLTECYNVAKRHEDCRFMLVLGPRSRLRQGNQQAVPGHIIVRRYVPDLDQVLGSCDVAVVHGGYNSLLESVYGGAIVVVVPNEGEIEQMEHARRLATLADVRVTTTEALENVVGEALRGGAKRPVAPLIELDLDGARRVSEQVSRDLAAEPPDEE